MMEKTKRERLIAEKGGKCWYCGLDKNWPYKDINIVLDHVVPVAKGGKATEDNLVPCCASCNKSKKDRSLEEFRVHRAKQWGMTFSQEQIAYWEGERGLTLPVAPQYRFWFELTPEEKEANEEWGAWGVVQK